MPCRCSEMGRLRGEVRGRGRKIGWIPARADVPSCRLLDQEEEGESVQVQRNMLYKTLSGTRRETKMYVHFPSSFECSSRRSCRHHCRVHRAWAYQSLGKTMGMLIDIALVLEVVVFSLSGIKSSVPSEELAVASSTTRRNHALLRFAAGRRKIPRR